MDLNEEYLLRFRNLELSKQELIDLIPKDFTVNERIVVCNNHLIHLLESYKINDIDTTFLLDWVNTVWFSEWFTYCDEQCNCIANVMNELEEIDEEGHELNPEKIKKYIFALENNLEI